MSADDPYAAYVIAAYAGAAVILVGLIWASVVASARARRTLADLEKERGR